MFLGSNIGNYDSPGARALLAGRAAPPRARRRACCWAPTGARARPLLLPAYDDAAGVTARFSKNVLVRLNRELGADFDLERFRTSSSGTRARSRLELYLESTRAQRVTCARSAAEVSLRARASASTPSRATS